MCSCKMGEENYIGTKEQHQQLMQVIEEYKDTEGAVMPVMQKAQEIYGFLPEKVQGAIADGLSVPMSQIYGVATFYSQFNLEPKGKYCVSICMGTACYVKGSAEIYEKLKTTLGVEGGQSTEDMLFTLDATRCLGCCGLAPVITVNEEVYGRLKTSDIEGIIQKYRDIETKN